GTVAPALEGGVMRSIRLLPFFLLAWLLLEGVAASPAQAGWGGRQFPVPTPNSNPLGIAAGSDGNLWFTEYNRNQIGRVSTDGVFTEFPIPTPRSYPSGIAAGPDGNICVTEASANKLGRIPTTGVSTES